MMLKGWQIYIWNYPGTSEDDDTSDQEDEEEEAIDVSFLHKKCGGNNPMA